MKFLLSIFTLIILTGSCNSAKETLTEQKESSSQVSLSGTYNLQQLGSKDVSLKPVTIKFNDSTNEASGISGCNSFFGSYTLKENTIKFGPIVTSKKYCNPDLNTIEKDFIEALNKANSFVIKDNTLTFLNNDTKLFTATKNEASRPGKDDVVQDNYKRYSVIYKASTRGSFKQIEVSKTDIKISEDRGLKNIDTYPCNPQDWKALNNLLTNDIVENLDLLKAPTDNRAFDGAAHATLSVIKGDVLTMTPSFDHGKPPKEIESIVNKILSMAEIATKQ